MSNSPGAASLMSTFAGIIAIAGLGAFALSHRAELNQFVTLMISKRAAVTAAQTPGDEATQSEDNADIPVKATSDGGVQLKAGSDGHFTADAEINGRSVGVLVDTGATMVALTYEDAEDAGIFLRPSDFTGRASTANGVAKVAPITISKISIGDITVRNVGGTVAERGKLQKTLLGMTFLSRLSRVDMQSGSLILHE
jgi:aspartyl protease family protein